jgi:hypothetical protein
LEVANELSFHFVNGCVLLFEHSFGYFGSDLVEYGFLIFHDSGHDGPGNIGGIDHINAVDLIQNVLINFSILEFRILLDHDIKIFDIVDDKEQRGDVINVLIIVIEPSHHVIKLDFRI